MMSSSIAKSQVHPWKRLFRDICVYLLFECGLFVIVNRLVHATEAKLFGPYLALAVPGVIFLLLVRVLWRWEERGPSPRSLAFGWGLSVALFFLAVCAALFYSIVELQLDNPSDAVWTIGMMGVSFTVLGFSIPYKMTLERISAKAAKDMNGAQRD
jgi:hypothetical protein